jgi:F-type H+-transporting ATPase subunit a
MIVEQILLSNLFVNSPLEQFEVLNLISINAPIFDYFIFTLTNLGLYTLIVLAILVGFHILGNNDVKLVPSK